MSMFGSSNAMPAEPPKALGIDRNQVATHEHGRPVPYVFGKCEVGITFISQPWDFVTYPITSKVGKDDQVTGYAYYASFAAALCLGPLDALHEIRMDDAVVWEGTLTRGEDDFEPITIEGRGELRFYWGTETQDADDELAASGTAHPAYRGQAYIVALNMALGQNAQVPNMTFVVSRYPDPAWLTSSSNVSDDCHPIAIIGDLWENARYGLGESADALDQATLNATAAQLAAEGVGLSGVMDQADGFADLLAKVLENFDGYVSYDAQGRFGVRLIRGETGDDLTIDEDALTEDPDLEASAWSDTTNQVTVKFRNREKDWQEDSVAWNDRAAYAIQGATRTESIQRPWITRVGLAWQVAASWCQQQALPRLSGRLSVRADEAVGLDPGHTFRLSWATGGLAAVLFRVESISVRDPGDATVELRVIEDRGYLNAAEYEPTPDDAPDPAAYESEQIDAAMIVETPYGWAKEEDSHFVMLVARGDQVSTRITSWNEVAPDSYEIYRSTRTFGQSITLNGALPASAPAVGTLLVTITSPDNIPYDATESEALRGRSLLFLGTEILQVWGPTLVSGHQYELNYIRGAYACEPEDHADEAVGMLVFPTPSQPLLSAEWGEVATPGETTTWKFQPEVLGFPADLAGADEYALELTARAYLPLAPINLTANGDGHAPTYGTGEDVDVDWAMASPMRSLYPVEEDAPNFADWTKLQILDTATETVQWEAQFATTGDATISNATIQTALGGEDDFIIRAYNQRGGINSLRYAEILVTLI